MLLCSATRVLIGSCFSRLRAVCSSVIYATTSGSSAVDLATQVSTLRAGALSVSPLLAPQHSRRCGVAGHLPHAQMSRGCSMSRRCSNDNPALAHITARFEEHVDPRFRYGCNWNRGGHT